MLDLHVWGPAFGLPSIDAECLAIIAHFHHSGLPSTAWRLIPSNDPSICPDRTPSLLLLFLLLVSSFVLPFPSLPPPVVAPSHHLPALCHDGAWSSGYDEIVGYLKSKSLLPDLNTGLVEVQQDECFAFMTYLDAHAAPLVDLSLYASAANWAATTRPAYSALLSFPLTWTVPTLIRAEAIKRVEHLGLAELDTDFDPNAGLHLSAGRDALPETFRRHLPLTRAKKTVREEMTPEQIVAIRLLGLAEDCLTTLDKFMSEGGSDEKHPRFFDETQVSTLDCLAYGYLALMVKPQVPRSFLRDLLETKMPRLVKFVDDMLPTDLPWAAPEVPSLLTSSARVLDSVIRHTPGVGDHYANEMRQRAEKGTTGIDQRAVVLFMALAATGAALGYGYHAYKTLQPFGARSQLWRAQRGTSKLSQFGDLGSMLNSAMGVYESQPMGSAAAQPGNGQLVKVDSELD
ncbi:metaxin [Purpureocillium lilacinum]|uniref:Metaxin n=1 Tax=Purpureocillium lilacinum TaxID=33203 RepID=A0A2U3EDP2_PURLI|nr:metaxin [Purpureocillium lilacinum]